jgi:hypothetical protein
VEWRVRERVAARGFHGVELQYTSPWLPHFAAAAAARGLMFGAYTLPGPLGEVAAASLRDTVDQLTGEYRADLLRAAVEERNVAGAFDVGRAPVGGGRAVVERVVPVPLREERVLDARPGDAAATPGWAALRDEGLGDALLFRSASPSLLPLWDVDVEPAPGAREGFLLDVTARLDRLGEGEDQVLLGKRDGATGAALEVVNRGGAGWVRFVVGLGGAGVEHAYPVDGVPAPGDAACGGAPAELFTAPVARGEVHRFTGAYDGDGGVYLFIDGRCAATARPAATGSVAPNAVPFAVGGAPVDGAPWVRAALDGAVPRAAVLRWGDHAARGSSVN